MKLVALVLAHAAQEEINAPVNSGSGSTPLHLASTVGNLAMVQLLIWVKFFFILKSYKIRKVVFFLVIKSKFFPVFYSQMPM